MMSYGGLRTLDTLQEERANSPLGAQSNALPKNRSRSSSGNGKSKTVGLGIARRPSDNLLMNLVDKGPNAACSIPQPPKTNFITKVDRPISNDSIVTQSSDLFSSHPNSSSSSDSNSRGSSIIEDMNADNNNIDLEPSATIANSVEEGEDGTREFEDDDETDFYSTSTTSETLTRTTTQQQRQQKTKYIFKNSSMIKSQLTFSANTPSPLKHNLSRTASVPSNLYSKSAPSLPTKTRITPSQRYRLRKEQNKVALQNSIKQREKFYDEQESSFVDQGDIDDSIIWNIPVASHSTNSFLMSMHSTKPKPEFKRSGSQHSVQSSNSSFLDYHEMPPSPIPGLSKTSDLQFFQETSANLSAIYQNTSHRLSQSKLLQRTESAECLPLEFKTASENGMEDLRLVSGDKMQVCSPSRPSWLPPKDQEEKKNHERQIQKTIGLASMDQLDKNKEREEREIKNETNRQKLVLLMDRGITRQSSLNGLKKVVWETPLPNESRYETYDVLLQSNVRLISEKFIEPFDSISAVLDKMDFPHDKVVEIEQLTCKIPIIEKSKPFTELIWLLKLKSISQQGLLPGDELLAYHFLKSGAFTLQQIWELVNLIQLTCFNELTKEKYDSRVLNSRGVVAHYLLRTEAFKQEFNPTALNYNTWWNILHRVDHELFMWCMDIIVVNNSQSYTNFPVIQEKFQDRPWEYYRSKKVVVNYKILVSLMLSVLLNYHFGFTDLYSLASMEDRDFRIPCSMDELLDNMAINGVFVKKWQHYYKKF